MSQLDNNVEDDQQDNDVHLLPGDGINLDGKLYIVQSRSTQPHGYIVTDPLVRGVEHKMRNRDIKDWHDRQRLRFVMASEGRFPLGKQESLERSLRAFTEVEQTEMYRRQRYCLEVDSRGKRFERTEVNMTALADEVAERHGDTAPHGWASVNEWWVDWDRAGRDIRVLCPSYRRRGNRERRLEPFMTKAMENGVKEWLDLGRPKMSTRYINVIAECMNHHGGEEICMQILKADPEAWLWPSYKTFTIACRSVDRTTKISRRQGAQAARAEMHPVGDGPDVRLPFQRVEADFKYLRIFVVDDVTGFPLGTPYLMAAIDCFSGMIAGFDIGFDPPSYVSAARCLKHVIGFKKLEHLPRKEDGSPIIKNAWPVNGVPRTFVLDNDAAFHAESFEKTAKALNCHIDYVPPGEPWEKGKIERFWGTVQTAYVDMFPGNVLRIDKNPDVTYDPRKDATVTLSQLRLFITKALVDVHHIGIEPETYKRRIDIWNEAVAINPPRPVRDHGSLLELVGAYKKRRAERRGIRIFGLRYRSDALQKYRNGFDHDPMVEVRYDPQNIAVIQVIDREHGTSFEAKCSREDYAKGLSEHQHKVIQRRAKEIAGLGQMKRRSGGDLRLRAFDWEDEDDRDEWLEMMDTIQEHMFLKVEPELGTDDMARNMHQATGGIMDNIMKLVFRATSFAHRDKAEFVGKGHRHSSACAAATTRASTPSANHRFGAASQRPSTMSRAKTRLRTCRSARTSATTTIASRSPDAW